MLFPCVDLLNMDRLVLMIDLIRLRRPKIYEMPVIRIILTPIQSVGFCIGKPFRKPISQPLNQVRVLSFRQGTRFCSSGRLSRMISIIS